MMTGMLLAIDPGPHTGVAWFSDSGLTHTETVAADPQYGEIWQLRRLRAFLRGIARNRYQRNIIVLEDFRTIGPLTKDAKSTLWMVGYIRALALCDELQLVLQPASARTPWLTEAKSLLPHNPSRHERDAVAHGLAYLARQQQGIRLASTKRVSAR